MPKREHKLSSACWCKPRKQDDGSFLHHDPEGDFLLRQELPAMSEEEIGAVLSRRVREARDAAGISRDELAAQTGLDTHTVYRLERYSASRTGNAQRPDRIATLGRIVQALDLSWDEIMEGIRWGKPPKRR